MPKTAKTIFNTTEESNFILNMTPESYHRYNLKILQSFLILMPLFSILLEFIKVYSVPGMALSITGVFAIVFVFIGFMKSETPKSLFVPAYVLGAMLIWGLISLYNSYFYGISLFGSDGRSEGWLSLLFYGSFFLLGAQLGTDENRRKLLYGMFCMALVECLWSLLQMLPIGFPSYYQNLEPLLIFQAYLPSGLTGSPIFLAILLVMLLFPAMLESVFAEEKKQKTFSLLCVVCFACTAIRTQCLIGIAGTVISVVFSLIYILLQKVGKKVVPSVSAVALAILTGLGWNYVSPALNGTYLIDEENIISNQLSLYDGSIMWEDGAYRLNVSGYYIANNATNPNGTFNISSISDTYQYLWRSTAKIIGRFPLAGSGPDSLVYPQLYQNRTIMSNPNVFDRCYNYYLHIAGTLGIPMLLLFIVLMVLVIRNGAKASRSGNWFAMSFFGAVIVYLITMIIGASSITIAPLFWMIAGICISLPQGNTHQNN